MATTVTNYFILKLFQNVCKILNRVFKKCKCLIYICVWIPKFEHLNRLWQIWQSFEIFANKLSIVQIYYLLNILDIWNKHGFSNKYNTSFCEEKPLDFLIIFREKTGAIFHDDVSFTQIYFIIYNEQPLYTSMHYKQNEKSRTWVATGKYEKSNFVKG